jgi:transposase
MDTSRQSVTASPSTTQESAPAKRQIVEETLVPGASVAKVARSHGVNANQVFCWRKQHLAGRLGNSSTAIKLLPVTVDPSTPATLYGNSRYRVEAQRFKRKRSRCGCSA